MAVRIETIDGNFRPLLAGREPKKLASLLAEKIMSAMKITPAGQLLPEDYPWCFILPRDGKKERFYFGALAGGAPITAANPVMYAIVSYPWLEKELASNFHLGFWLARIIAARQQRNKEGAITLKTWKASLQSSYSPWRELLLNEKYKFSNNSEILLTALCRFDELTTSEQGVSQMPWKAWPEVIRNDRHTWLWRQNRYGNIIDSQRI